MACLMRSLLVWLLVLALPAQGLAAATMAFCGAGQHSVETATPAAQHSPSAQGHAATGHFAAHDHQAMVPEADGQLQAPADCAESHATPAAKAHQCSVCATCCSVGALPSTVLTVPVTAPVATVFATVAASVDFVAADGLERPPRAPRV